MEQMKPSSDLCGAGLPENPPPGGASEGFVRAVIAKYSRGPEEELELLDMMGLLADEAP
jgi:hypothetical protein